jgi:hypothetical protein
MVGTWVTKLISVNYKSYSESDELRARLWNVVLVYIQELSRYSMKESKEKIKKM